MTNKNVLKLKFLVILRKLSFKINNVFESQIKSKFYKSYNLFSKHPTLTCEVFYAPFHNLANLLNYFMRAWYSEDNDCLHFAWQKCEDLHYWSII